MTNHKERAGQTMLKETVTKLDVAKRQLNEAIRLFFEQRDTVSIHTLACASAQVLTDLCLKNGVGMPLRDGSKIKESRRKEWHQAMKASENFFKHADRDHSDAHQFNSEQTQWDLIDAIRMYEALTKRSTYEATVYQKWFILKYPDLLQDCEWKNTLLNTFANLELDASNFGFFDYAIKSKTLLPETLTKLFD
jgi:hypothetical protein